MKRLFSIIFIITLVSMGSAAFAGTYEYPGDNPIFAITFPDNWKIETEEELLHAMPADESIYLGLWALDEVENLDAAIDALDEILADQVTELEFEDPVEREINEIPLLTIDGTGKVSDEVSVVVSVALFSPDEETIFIVLFFGTPEAVEKHSEALDSVVNSIQAK